MNWKLLNSQSDFPFIRNVKFVLSKAALPVRFTSRRSTAAEFPGPSLDILNLIYAAYIKSLSNRKPERRRNKLETESYWEWRSGNLFASSNRTMYTITVKLNSFFPDLFSRIFSRPRGLSSCRNPST